LAESLKLWKIFTGMTREGKKGQGLIDQEKISSALELFWKGAVKGGGGGTAAPFPSSAAI